MFLSGHEEIVAEVLREGFSGRYFDTVGVQLQRFRSFRNFTEASLVEGLRYVDAPCGHFKVLRDGRVRLTSRRVCGLSDWAMMLRESTFSEVQLFQFHKGYFAHLHSMTTDPRNTVGKIRAKVLRSVLGFCLLALFGDAALVPGSPNKLALSLDAGYLGMALHVLTDSYSPAHTLRAPERGVRVPLVPARKQDRGFITQIAVHDAVKALARGLTVQHRTEKAFLAALTEGLTLELEYVRGREKQLWRAYKAMEFEYETIRAVESILGGPGKIDAAVAGDLGVSKNVAGPGSPKPAGPRSQSEREGDVTSFQYYGVQSTLQHARLDLLSSVRARPLVYKRMKAECCEFLRMFRDAVASMEETGPSRQKVRGYLLRVLRFLVDGPFRIHRSRLGRRTDLVAAALA